MNYIENILSRLEQMVSRVDTQTYHICFRGLGEWNWTNTPYIFRDNRLQYEKNSLEEAERNYPDEFLSAHTVDKLTKLQHYECPTRMMDVTNNFFVALFFACGGWTKVNNFNSYKALLAKTGAVRIFKVRKEDIKSIDSETVTVIANIARMKDGDNFGKLPWLCERDWGVWQSDEDQILQNAKDANSVVYVKTKLNNPRVRAQYGDFFLFGGLEGIESVGSPNSLRKAEVKKKTLPFPEELVLGDVLIDGKKKESILRDLENYFGISYATMCPEMKDFIKVLMK